MPLLARASVALGALFLIHAAYSAKEHTQLLSLSPSAAAPPTDSSSSSSTNPLSALLPALRAPTASLSISSLPTDITVETLVALALLALGIVLSAEPLKPIRWGEWAAEVEHGEHGKNSRYVRREGDAARMTAEQLGQRLYGGPSVEGYGWLEDGKRMGFFDIRSRRKEFAEWVKKGGEKEK